MKQLFIYRLMNICDLRIAISGLLVYVAASTVVASDLTEIEYKKPQQKNITIYNELETIKVTNFSKAVILGTLTNKTINSYKFDTPESALDSYVSSLLTDDLDIRKSIYESFFGEKLSSDKIKNSLQGEELVEHINNTTYVLTKIINLQKGPVFFVEVRDKNTDEKNGLLPFPLKENKRKWTFDKANRNLGVIYWSYPFKDKIILNSKKFYPFIEIPSAASSLIIDCEIIQ